MTHDTFAGHFAPQQSDAQQQASSTLDAQARDTTQIPEAQKSGAAPGGSPDSPAARFFRGAARMGPLLLLILLAAQVWPAFLGNNFYCPHEARSILIFSQTAQSGQWLAPAAGDLAQWPVFSCFLAGIAKTFDLFAVPQTDLLFSLAAALSALLALLGVWTLSRVAGFDAPAALAAGLLLLCAPLFAPLPQYTGPEPLAAALLLFSLTCFCFGWQKERAWLSLPAGFVLAGLAGLAGGLFHLLLPLLASFAFLIWRGNLRRAQGPDALAGFVLMLLMLAGWLGSVILLVQAEGYLRHLSAHFFFNPWASDARWWLPLAAAAAGLIPWLAIVLCVSWKRALPEAWSYCKNRRSHNGGSAFLWIALVSGCLLSLITPDLPGSVVALVCLAAPLLGRALLRLSRLGSRIFYLFAALCLLHAGMALAAAGFGPSLDWLARFFSHPLTPEQREMILGLTALPILGAICLVAALALTRFTRRDQPGGALMVCALFAAVLAQPAALLLTPELAAAPQSHLRRAGDIVKAGPARADEALTIPAVPPAQQAAPQPAPAQPAAPTEPNNTEELTEPRPDDAREQTAPAQPAVVPGQQKEEPLLNQARPKVSEPEAKGVPAEPSQPLPTEPSPRAPHDEREPLY
ncbi:hypothetical protein [Desulfovibrio sp. ZJ369]|uniref:hypothetical protein n=1 Tax=Desulfovibrio sp. ZJ369 TaxID=2709793 RepID=UPI0013EC34A4|nr:hypothetical protein [Desulfovibrio sp. ZJ369]